MQECPLILSCTTTAPVCVYMHVCMYVCMYVCMHVLRHLLEGIVNSMADMPNADIIIGYHSKNCMILIAVAAVYTL